MNNEKGQKVYRKLEFFFENKFKVHFKDTDGIFYNGLIIDLSEEKLTMVLAERVLGTRPFLLESIDPDSISQFTEGRR